VPHGDDIAAADEDMGLTELHAALDALGGLQDDEQAFAVDLQLRPLMGAQGILDGELVQPEPLLHLLHQLRARLVQPDPYEAALAGLDRVEMIDVEIGDAASVRIGGAADHHVHDPNSPVRAAFL
jgi:hypothetical protein